MEKILIDGYNLLYKDGALKNQAERSLEAARDELVAAVAAYRTGEMEIVIVFDGKGGEGCGRAGIAPGIQVRFSRHPQSADQLILELLQAERRRSSLTVVTSDRKDIGRIAQAEGVRWISSEAFLRRLRRAPRRATPGGEKPVPSPEEMDYWLRRFSSAPPEGEEDASSGGEVVSPPSRVSRRRRPISARRRTSR